MRSARRRRDFISLDEEALKSSCGLVQSQLMELCFTYREQHMQGPRGEGEGWVPYWVGLGWTRVSDLGFLLLWQTPWRKVSWERKGLFHLTHLISSSLREARAGTQTGQESVVRVWCRFHGAGLLTGLFCVACFRTSCFIYLRTSYPGWHCSEWAGPSHINLQENALQICLQTTQS